MISPLRHKDHLVIDGKRCYLGTVTGYAEQYREDPATAYNRAILNGHETHWIGRECSVICADKGYYDRENAKYADAPNLATGDTVRIGDFFNVREFQIQRAPNENYRLVPVPPIDVRS